VVDDVIDVTGFDFTGVESVWDEDPPKWDLLEFYEGLPAETERVCEEERRAIGVGRREQQRREAERFRRIRDTLRTAGRTLKDWCVAAGEDYVSVLNAVNYLDRCEAQDGCPDFQDKPPAPEPTDPPWPPHPKPYPKPAGGGMSEERRQLEWGARSVRKRLRDVAQLDETPATYDRQAWLDLYGWHLKQGNEYEAMQMEQAIEMAQTALDFTVHEIRVLEKLRKERKEEWERKGE